MPYVGQSPVDLDCAHGTVAVGRRTVGSTLSMALRKRMFQTMQTLGNAGGRLSQLMMDVSITVCLLMITSPLWLLVLATITIGRNPFNKRVCIGLDGRRFKQYEFATDRMIGGKPVRFLGLQKTPRLFGVLTGNLRLVGPRSTTAGEVDFSHETARYRLAVKPGIVSLWTVREMANMAYESEWKVDLEYVQQSSLWRDWGIILSSLPSLFIRRGHLQSPRGELFGIPFDNVTMTEAIDQICHAASTPELTKVAFINADCINKACVDDNYQDALQRADRVYADGVGVRIAGRILGCPVRENVNGTDLFPRLCSRLSKSSARVFLLGGRPGVADSVATWAKDQFPQLNICGSQHGYYPTEEQESVVQRINASGVDVILVAFGAPKQDVWIRDVLADSNARVAIGVGGLFDFYSGRIPRAPIWMREMGLEWIYRLMQEPGRLWRRYVIGNITFLGRAILFRIARRDQGMKNRVEVG